MKRRLSGRSIKLFALASVVLLVAALFGFLLYRWLDERPRPTVFDWRPVVTTYAGDGSPGFQDAAPGSPASARFADPFGLAIDREGNLYVADAGSSNRIRKLAPDGSVTTLAGGREGFADGQGAAAAFNTPSALAIDRPGNLYVADTSNNRIRKITPEGLVTTLAGDGTAGSRDGAASEAQFNAPVGVAVDNKGSIYVADTYNDRIRQITPDAQVRTLAGGDAPGYADGGGSAALFDTPCALAVADDGTLYVADTGNRRIRKLTPDGQVSTINLLLKHDDGQTEDALQTPVGLALTHDNFLYVTDIGQSRVLQIAPDGAARVVAGSGDSFADGDARQARFNAPVGIALDRRGALYVADSSNYLVRKLISAEEAEHSEKETRRLDTKAESDSVDASPFVERREVLPRLTPEMLNTNEFPWPVEPQRQWHEVVATMGEVRGSFDGESRHHLHSGIDIQGAQGATVRVVLEEKVTSPLANWDFGGLNEGVQIGLMTYVHLRVGRDAKDEPLSSIPFIIQRDTEGKVSRVRIRRGTRLRVGDALGTVNRMYHVHLNFGPNGAQANPLKLPFVGFTDSVAPTIEPDGIQIFDSNGQKLTAKRNNRLRLTGDVSIVVDAFDQVDKNLPRRRLGLYQLGYQLLRPDGTPAPGFDEPRINIEFERLPPRRDAVKIAYADASGITVYGSAATRFLYVVTNLVRDGQARQSFWRTAELPPGDYLLRIFAADYAGNIATARRDLPVIVE
ncbi:MAG TPA: hypothetical protein VGB73_11385 [Pyrinomonadaceae bacterium]|jgi:sugar lactone lactonase YvrE